MRQFINLVNFGRKTEDSIISLIIRGSPARTRVQGTFLGFILAYSQKLNGNPDGEVYFWTNVEFLLTDHWNWQKSVKKKYRIPQTDERGCEFSSIRISMHID